MSRHAREPVDDRGHDYFPLVASALAGAIVCIALTIASGGREAVDTAGYYVVGIPLMAATIFAISYVFPMRAWRWTLSMAAGQLVAMLLAGSSLSLWPLAIVSMLFLSIPQFIAGLMGSRLAKRRTSD